MNNLENPLYIEVLSTLEQIERMNKAIAFHQSFETPDQLAIEQYQYLKNDFTRQLVELLKQLNIAVEAFGLAA